MGLVRPERSALCWIRSLMASQLAMLWCRDAVRAQAKHRPHMGCGLLALCVQVVCLHNTAIVTTCLSPQPSQPYLRHVFAGSFHRPGRQGVQGVSIDVGGGVGVVAHGKCVKRALHTHNNVNRVAQIVRTVLTMAQKHAGGSLRWRKMGQLWLW